MYKCKGVGLYTYSLSAPSNAEQASSRLVGGRGCRTALYPKPHKDEFLVELKSGVQGLNVTLIVQNWELLMSKVDITCIFTSTGTMDMPH